jgi:general stress protein 26
MCPSYSWHISADHLVQQVDNIVLHKFTMGDVEDPYVYAAFPISEWQQTEKGTWVMQHVIGEPKIHVCFQMYDYRNHVAVTGSLNAEDYTYYLLRWGTDT